MPWCRIEPARQPIWLDKGETLYEGLKKSRPPFASSCGGNGICGGCRIWVNPPQHTAATPHPNISAQDEAKGLRLACRAIPTGDVSIRMENHSADDKTWKILEFHDRSVFTPPVLSQPQNTLAPLGIAVDIGTTTLVVALVSLVTGKILGTASAVNPQVVHGHDVLTRIMAAKPQEGLKKMASLVRDRLNALIKEICLSSGYLACDITDGVIAGNPTMLQLAASMDSTPIGKAPFRADIRGSASYPAPFFGLHLHPEASLYLPPVLHAFVGTDISAGLLVCPDFFNPEKNILFIDLGTNGEICLNARGDYYAASTAAGPAFEGMGLSSGMPAMDGAVERIEIHNKAFQFHTIGQKKIKGICGSGALDLLARLIETGYLDASGRFHENENNPPYLIHTSDQTLAFQYADGLCLTQKDVRLLQLAKSAVRTGIEMILQTGRVHPDNLDQICMAGGFGTFLNPARMEAIGLIPENCAPKLVFSGNTALSGCIRLLKDPSQRIFLENRLKTLNYLEVARSKSFMQSFIKNLVFS